MNPRLPRITATELVRALHRDGWHDSEQVGSHLTLRHRTKQGKVVVPMHRGKTIKPGLLNGILKDAGLTREELGRLL